MIKYPIMILSRHLTGCACIVSKINYIMPLHLDTLYKVAFNAR